MMSPRIRQGIIIASLVAFALIVSVGGRHAERAEDVSQVAELKPKPAESANSENERESTSIAPELPLSDYQIAPQDSPGVLK